MSATDTLIKSHMLLVILKISDHRLYEGDQKTDNELSCKEPGVWCWYSFRPK